MSCISMKASTSLSTSASRCVRQAPVVRHQARHVVCRAAGTDGFESAGKDLKKAANKAGNQLADNIDSAQSKVEREASKVERKASDTYTDAKVEAKSAQRDSTGAAKKTADDVGNALDRGIDKLNRGVDNLKGGVEHVQDSAATVGEQLKEVGRFASGKVQEAVDASRKKADDAGHQ